MEFTKEQLAAFVKANTGKVVEISVSKYGYGGGKIVGFNAADRIIFISLAQGRDRDWYRDYANVFLDNGKGKVAYIHPRDILLLDDKKPTFEVNGKSILFGVSSGSNGKSKYKIKIEKKELFSGSKMMADMEIEGHTLRDAKRKAGLL